MKQKMKKQIGVNDGMPHGEKVCGDPFFLKGYCSACGWHLRYHANTAKPNESLPVKMQDDDGADSDLAGDVVDIAAGVGSIIGAAMDVFSSDDGDSSSSSDFSSNDSDNSGDGGDFGGGGADSGW